MAVDVGERLRGDARGQPGVRRDVVDDDAASADGGVVAVAEDEKEEKFIPKMSFFDFHFDGFLCSGRGI